MTWGLVAAAAGTVIGGVVASKGAKDAAKTQSASADKANQLAADTADKQLAFQREAMNKQIELQQPFRDIGLSAQNQLAKLLGLSNTGYNATDPEIQRIRAELAPKFTTALPDGGSVEHTRDLDAAVQARLNADRTTKGSEFGSLAQDFAEAPPAVADFAMKDFQADPGYQFQLAEGEKARNRFLSSRGLYNSGRAGKELERFGQGLASQEFGNAFNRYQTNRGNKVADWQNRLNLFNINRNNKLQPLQSLGGVAQNATNQMSGAAQNFATGASNAVGGYGQTAGSNIIGAGNAQAAAGIAGGNAINGALSNATSMYQQNNMLNRLFPAGGSSYGQFQSSPMSPLLYSNGSLGD